MADEKDKEIERLKAQLEQANKDKETQAKELEQAGDVVTDLKKQLSEKPTSAPDSHGQVKVGQTAYDLTVKGFHYKGSIVDIDVLKEDAKLVEELIKEGVGFLRKVVK